MVLGVVLLLLMLVVIVDGGGSGSGGGGGSSNGRGGGTVVLRGLVLQGTFMYKGKRQAGGIIFGVVLLYSLK